LPGGTEEDYEIASVQVGMRTEHMPNTSLLGKTLVASSETSMHETWTYNEGEHTLKTRLNCLHRETVRPLSTNGAPDNITALLPWRSSYLIA
jgi:hypothetical protein